VLPLTVGIRDSAVQLVSTLGSVVNISMSKLGSIITSALSVATVLICQLTRQGVCERHRGHRPHGTHRRAGQQLSPRTQVRQVSQRFQLREESGEILPRPFFILLLF
jgi:hypothetical protein